MGPKVNIPVPSASKPAVKDSNAILGVAIGAAPLLAVPVVGLSVLRSALSKTQARRALIEKEIYDAEQARIQQKKDSAANFQALLPAVGLLGASVTILGLIILAPFSNPDLLGSVMKKPEEKAAVTKTVKAPELPGAVVAPKATFAAKRATESKDAKKTVAAEKEEAVQAEEVAGEAAADAAKAKEVANKLKQEELAAERDAKVKEAAEKEAAKLVAEK